jgi:hypothetical protein
MKLELSEQNARRAFGEVVEATGIGCAAKDCDALLPEKVLVRVPQAMHADFPARLLASVTHVCGDEPYGWSVESQEPIIDVSTTFQSLLDDWFLKIIY